MSAPRALPLCMSTPSPFTKVLVPFSDPHQQRDVVSDAGGGRAEVTIACVLRPTRRQAATENGVPPRLSLLCVGAAVEERDAAP